MVNDTRQGLIGHDAPAMPWVRHGHSGYGGGYGGFEGHRKEDVTSKVSDPPFVNFDQGRSSFLVAKSAIKRRIIAHTSWSGGIRMLPCISTSRNTIVLS